MASRRHRRDSLSSSCRISTRGGDPWPYQNIPPTKDGAFPKGVQAADGVECLFDWIMNAPVNRFDHNDEIAAVKE